MAAFDLASFAGSELESTSEDNIIGELSEPSRRLLGLYLGAQQRIKRICGEYQELSSELEHVVSERHGMVTEDDEPKLERLEELRRQYDVAALEAESFSGIFWSAVRLEFEVLLNKHCLCVVDGFKVSWRYIEITNLPVSIKFVSSDPFGHHGFGRG